MHLPPKLSSMASFWPIHGWWLTHWVKGSRSSVTTCLLSTGLCTTVIALLTPGSGLKSSASLQSPLVPLQWISLTFPQLMAVMLAPSYPPSIHFHAEQTLPPDGAMITHASRNAEFSLPVNLFSYWVAGHMKLNIRRSVDTYMDMKRTLLAEAFIWNLSAQVMPYFNAIF